MTERVFMNHKCRGLAKLEELQSPIGQAAYSYYCEWMKCNRRSVQKIETFASSSFYSTFIKFAQHVKKVRLPNPTGFIKTMVDNGNVQPSLWCRDNVYAMYLQSYDAVVTPTQQFIGSVEEVMNLAKEYQCAPQDVFNAIGVEAVLDLVQKRKLSPWFLVASEAFRDWMMSRRPDQASDLEDAIQVGALLARVSQSEALRVLITDFSKATKELQL